MDRDAERRAILHEDNIGLEPDEASYANLVLTACQEALGSPHAAMFTLDVITYYDGELLADLATAIMAAPISEQTRRATLYGALKMAQAYLWRTIPPDDAD